MPKAKMDIDNNAMGVSRPHGGQLVKGRLWVEKDDRTFLSWGRVVLLERVGQEGSVSAAAKALNMSFSHAWGLVKSMNALSDEPLVETRAGGKGGGGAWLTPAGQRAVADFWDLVRDFQGWIAKQKL